MQIMLSTPLSIRRGGGGEAVEGLGGGFFEAGVRLSLLLKGNPLGLFTIMPYICNSIIFSYKKGYRTGEQEVFR